jgi:hypothetical protein
LSDDEKNHHDTRVDAWMAWAATDRPERLFEAFEGSFGAMWRRAYLTLGDVTLIAILDRVLYTAAERFPVFSSLEVNAKGLQSDRFRAIADGSSRDDLGEGIRFVLVEFLTVLGNLTGEVLTPALHAELAKATVDAVPGEETKS